MRTTAAPRRPFITMCSSAGTKKSERKTWAVIWLCGVMMVAEIVGGLMFGSIALVADAMNMSTHAGALLLTRARLGRLRSLSHLTVEVRVSP